MLVLSFRDMSVPRRGGVTPAAIYDLSPVNAGMSWWPAPQLRPAPWRDVTPIVDGKHVCFLVHGFNVDRDNGYTGYGAFGQELEPGGMLPGLGPPPLVPIDLEAAGVDVVIPVLWAGDWYLPVNYPFLLPDIRLTGRYFADLILSSATNMARVSFVTHSMGARVVFEAVQRTMVGARAAGVKPPVFDMAILTAPATSDEILDDPNYADAVAAIEEFVVVSSRADRVLSLAFPLGNRVEQAMWPNDPGANAALGRYGPRLKSGSKALGKTGWYEIPPATKQRHSDYVPEPSNPVAPYPNGWSPKRLAVGALAQAVLDGQPAPWPPAKTVTPRGG